MHIRITHRSVQINVTQIIRFEWARARAAANGIIIAKFKFTHLNHLYPIQTLETYRPRGIVTACLVAVMIIFTLIQCLAFASVLLQF